MARRKKRVVPFKERDSVQVQHTEEMLKGMAEKLDLTIGAWRGRAARENEPQPVPKHLSVMIKQSAALKEIKPEKVYSVVQASSRTVTIDVEGVDVDIPIKDGNSKVKITKV